MSGKRERERRETRLDGEAEAAERERRRKLVQLGGAVALLAVVVVGVLIAVSQGGGDDGGDITMEGAAAVERELRGIPQRGVTLGRRDAPATVVEFADLQCPICAEYAEEVLPEVISGPVRDGTAKLEFRNFLVIGPESRTAGAAALAAGEQGRGWHFIEVFYRNQGREHSGYVTDEFLAAVARAAGVPDIDRWDERRRSQDLLREVSRTTNQALDLGLQGTPSFAVRGRGGLEVLGTPGGAGPILAAVRRAG